MSNWEMLTSEFCGEQELERYMNNRFLGGQVSMNMPYDQRPENSWDYWDLMEECDNNLEDILDFLGVSWRSWRMIEDELRPDDDDGDWDMNAPDGPWTFQPERVEKWW